MTEPRTSTTRWVLGRIVLTILSVAGTLLLSTLLGVTVLNTGQPNSGAAQGAMVWPVLAAPTLFCLWWRPPVTAGRKWAAWALAMLLGLATYFALRSPRVPLWTDSVEISAIIGVIVAWRWLRPGGSPGG
jgi:hypothetical protein